MLQGDALAAELKDWRVSRFVSFCKVVEAKYNGTLSCSFLSQIPLTPTAPHFIKKKSCLSLDNTMGCGMSSLNKAAENASSNMASINADAHKQAAAAAAAVAPTSAPAAVDAPAPENPRAAAAESNRAPETEQPTPAAPAAAVAEPAPEPVFGVVADPNVLTVVVSGAAGQIGYSLLPLLANGEISFFFPFLSLKVVYQSEPSASVCCRHAWQNGWATLASVRFLVCLFGTLFGTSNHLTTPHPEHIRPLRAPTLNIVQAKYLATQRKSSSGYSKSSFLEWKTTLLASKWSLRMVDTLNSKVLKFV